jgi:hypothetical protein
LHNYRDNKYFKYCQTGVILTTGEVFNKISKFWYKTLKDLIENKPDYTYDWILEQVAFALSLYKHKVKCSLLSHKYNTQNKKDFFKDNPVKNKDIELLHYCWATKKFNKVTIFKAGEIEEQNFMPNNIFYKVYREYKDIKHAN